MLLDAGLDARGVFVGLGGAAVALWALSSTFGRVVDLLLVGRRDL